MGTHPQEEVRFRQHEAYSELTSVCKNTPAVWIMSLCRVCLFSVEGPALCMCVSKQHNLCVV